jgi:hypothetical protein
MVVQTKARGNDMTQAYSDPSRESDEHALPDIEVFYADNSDDIACSDPHCERDHPHGAEPGWYWWQCFPGCLPDGEPNGPFATEAEALADAQST